MDVWDLVNLKNRIHCTTEERDWLKKLQGERFEDIMRAVNGKSHIYTWWPYKQGCFENDEGLRFDGVICDKELSKSIDRIYVNKDERKSINGAEKPSDHAPIIIDF